jgi:hypothetical protein
MALKMFLFLDLRLKTWIVCLALLSTVGSQSSPPDGNESPGGGSQSSVGSQLSAGNQASTGSQSSVGSQPSAGSQSSAGSQYSAGSQSSTGSQSSAGSQSSTGSQSSVGNQSSAGSKSSSAATESNLYFSYGEGFADVSAERWLEPSERGRLDVSEACEGDVIHLGCPSGAVIQFAKKSYFHFGRGGPWEQNTSCGTGGIGGTGGGGRSRAAANCTTVNGRRLVEAACGGRSACTVALRGRFPGADPCPVGSAALRKYFIFRYTCAVTDEGKKRKGQWALGSSLSRCRVYRKLLRSHNYITTFFFHLTYK